MKADLDKLRVEEILEINRRIAECGVPYTGMEEYEVRKDKVEELVKNTPARSPTEIAAYYLKNISLLQPFPDANHRTALIAAEIYLNRKGYDLAYTAEEADALRNRMLELQWKIYGTYEEMPAEVLGEPDNELFRLCLEFIRAHVKRRRV